MPNTPRVFISYARRDGEVFANKLRGRLEVEQPEITVWQDRSQMEGGVGWWKQITTALESVDYLVLIMTPAALHSEVSFKEWRYARQVGVCVYPVKGVPDEELNFDAMPLWMRQSHFFDIDREWETFVRHLKSPCHANRVPFLAPDLPAGFILRRDFTGQIRDLILAPGDPGRRNPKPGTVVLYGAGGLGKTSIAAAVCHDEDVITAFPDGILWATLGEKPSPGAALAEIYAALTGERPAFANEEDAANEVSRRLEDRHYLIVIDDVWSPAHLRPFLRGGPGCVRLITTRQFEIAIEFTTEDRRIKTPQMERDEAVDMLLGSLPVLPAERAAFRSLAGRLGRWPLMLTLARGTLNQRLARGDSVPGALLYINQALDRKGFTVFDSAHATDRHSGLSKTIQVSLDLLDPLEQQCCFELSVFPEDTNIPLADVALLWGRDDFEAEQLAGRLDGLSLLELDLRKGSLRLHDLMRGYFRGKLAAQASVHQRLIDAWGDPKKLRSIYAWRWYVFHLAASGKTEAITALLTDFDWLRIRLGHVDINTVIADYEYVRSAPPLFLIRSCLRLVAHAVNTEPTELASQLLGRLTADSSEVKTLLDGAARYSAHTWLRPIQPSLTPPGGPIVRLLTGHEGPIRDVVVSSDGLRIVSASAGHEILIWDIRTWSLLRNLTGHTSAVNAVKVGADGRLVLSGSDDCTARLWNADTGQELFTLSGHTAAVRAVALAANAPRAVTGSFDRSVTVWDTETGLALHTFIGHEDWVRAVAITDDGLRIVSTSMDRTFRVWDVVAGTELQILRIHQEPARALSLCPVSMRLLSGADDGSIRMWNPDGSGLRTLCETGASIRAISMSADGRRAISLGSDDKLSLWDLEAWHCLRTLEGPAGSINTAAVSPDGSCAITGSHDETLRVWDLESRTIGPGPLGRSHSHGHSGWVNAVAISADGTRAVSGSYDGTLKLWDGVTGFQILSLTPQGGAVRAVAIAGEIVVSGSDGGPSLSIWNSATGVLLSASAETSSTNAIAVDLAGQRAVSGSPDGVLRIWDLVSCKPSYTIRAHAGSIMAVSMNAAGTLALTASSDKTVKCWDVTTGREIHTLRGHTNFVRSVSISHDGALAISGSSVGEVKIWDLSSGALLLDLHEDIGTVNSVAIVNGGRRAVSGSGDHTVRLWALDTARSIASFTADDVVTACAIAADSPVIIAGDASGVVHLLRIEAAGDEAV